MEKQNIVEHIVTFVFSYRMLKDEIYCCLNIV